MKRRRTRSATGSCDSIRDEWSNLQADHGSISSGREDLQAETTSRRIRARRRSCRARSRSEVSSSCPLVRATPGFLCPDRNDGNEPRCGFPAACGHFPRFAPRCEESRELAPPRCSRDVVRGAATFPDVVVQLPHHESSHEVDDIRHKSILHIRLDRCNRRTHLVAHIRTSEYEEMIMTTEVRILKA